MCGEVCPSQGNFDSARLDGQIDWSKQHRGCRISPVVIAQALKALSHPAETFSKWKMGQNTFFLCKMQIDCICFKNLGVTENTDTEEFSCSKYLLMQKGGQVIKKTRHGSYINTRSKDIIMQSQINFHKDKYVAKTIQWICQWLLGLFLKKPT